MRKLVLSKTTGLKRISFLRKRALCPDELGVSETRQVCTDASIVETVVTGFSQPDDDDDDVCYCGGN